MGQDQPKPSPPTGKLTTIVASHDVAKSTPAYVTEAARLNRLVKELSPSAPLFATSVEQHILSKRDRMLDELRSSKGHPVPPLSTEHVTRLFAMIQTMDLREGTMLLRRQDEIGHRLQQVNYTSGCLQARACHNAKELSHLNASLFEAEVLSAQVATLLAQAQALAPLMMEICDLITEEEFEEIRLEVNNTVEATLEP